MTHRYYKHKALYYAVAINEECAIMVGLPSKDKSFFIKKMTGAARDFIDRETKIRDYEPMKEEDFYNLLNEVYTNIQNCPYL